MGGAEEGCGRAVWWGKRASEHAVDGGGAPLGLVLSAHDDDEPYTAYD